MTKAYMLDKLVNLCYFCIKLHLPSKLTYYILCLIRECSRIHYPKYDREPSFARGYPFHSDIVDESSDYLYDLQLESFKPFN